MPGPDGFRDWEELHVPLHLPYKGKRYVIPPVSMETGLLLRLAQSEDKATADTAAERLGLPSGEGESGWHRRMLGAAYDEMLTDGVPWSFVDRCAKTALADHQYGRLGALAVWDVASDPKAWAELLRLTAQIASAA